MARFITTLGILALVLAAACTTVVDEPNNLDSFKVTLTQGKGFNAGTPDTPAPYISGASCDALDCPDGEECIGYCSIDGAACQDDTQCPQNDYCQKMCARPVWIDIDSLGKDGWPIKLKADRWVSISVQPGVVPPPYRFTKLLKGQATSVQLYVAQAVGTSHIWVEDLGLGPKSGRYGECNNEIDDDGDGWIDMGDLDCNGPEDPTESRATYATGLSDTLFFETPSTWHVQYAGNQVSTSPLEGQNVLVETGALVVTNVVSNGFYVTDLDGQMETLPNGMPGYFNSFFLYTFSKPEGIHYGDVICNYSGGIIEHEGNTQMTYPTYEIFGADGCVGRLDATGDLKVPDPVDVTDLLQAEDPSSGDYKTQMMENAGVLEPFESSLIKIRNASVATRYIACDSDEDGEYPAGSDDDLCRDECQKDPYCTQLESYFKYSQLAAFALKPPVEGSTAPAGKKFYVGTDMLKKQSPLTIPYIGAKDESGNCPDILDIETGEVATQNPHMVVLGDTLYHEYACPAMDLKEVSGTLRHIYLCPKYPGKKESCALQMHMVVPRFDSDFVVAE